MKLYGKELDAEIARRAEARDVRIDERKTIRVKAKELGRKPSEYLDWENGHDVCPHEDYKKSLGGVHPPFLLMECCTKCGHGNIIAKIETDEDYDKYKDELEEAFKNTKESLEKRKNNI